MASFGIDFGESDVEIDNKVFDEIQDQEIHLHASIGIEGEHKFFSGMGSGLHEFGCGVIFVTTNAFLDQAPEDDQVGSRLTEPPRSEVTAVDVLQDPEQRIKEESVDVILFGNDIRPELCCRCSIVDQSGDY